MMATEAMRLPAGSAEVGFADVVRFLSRRQSYPDHPRHVDVLETHISCVFLTDRMAYKLKKPVRYDFVDFSSLEGRRQACQEEVRLNRRMAPLVYAPVMPVTVDARGRLALNGHGNVVNWVVPMRRLPAARMLDQLIRSGELTDADVASLSEMLARCYEQAPPLTIRPARYRAAFESRVSANLEELLSPDHRLPKRLIRRLHAAQMRLLRFAPEVLDRRVRDGRVIDGHGDLRPEHLCLISPPVAFDCLEFDAALRQIDVADELSFLAMECDKLGAPHVGQQVFDAYVRASRDSPPEPLVHFYKCYRACVRAKVAALRGRQLTGAAAADARAEANEYVQWADRHTAALGRPALLLVRGRSGTGKSTLARAVAESLGAECLSTDEVRRELLGTSGRPAAYGQGIYTAEKRRFVYQEMNRRAASLLQAGIPVILDGTFLTGARRGEALAVAQRLGLPALIVQCRCPDELARRRIETRRGAMQTLGDRLLSDAWPELTAAQKLAEEESTSEAASIIVDTTQCLASQAAAVLSALRRLDPLDRWHTSKTADSARH